MRRRWKRATALTLSASLVGACATSPDKIETAYVSPVTYQNYTCAQLRAELGRVTQRAHDLHASLQERADNDTGKMVVGMVLFWPILFALEGESTAAQEYARLKGERDMLEKLATEKNCRHITIVDVPAQQPGDAVAGRSKEERLQELKALKDKGLLSDQVYHQEQLRVLAEAAPAAARPPHAGATAAPAAQATPATARPAGLQPGDRWEYEFRDSRKAGSVARSFVIEQASAQLIVERISLADGNTLSAEHRAGAYLELTGGMQFAPYYFAFQPEAATRPIESLRVSGGDACANRRVGGGDYAASHECEVRAEFTGPDLVSVAAGTFESQRVRVKIASQMRGGYMGARRRNTGEGTFWISAASGRLVKAVVKYDAERPWTETMELVSMKVAMREAPPSPQKVVVASASTSVPPAAAAARTETSLAAAQASATLPAPPDGVALGTLLAMGARALSPEQTKTVLTGGMLRGVTPDGAAVLASYNPDGTLTGSVGGRDLAEGKWRLDRQGRMCVDFWIPSLKRSWENVCRYWFELGGKLYFPSDSDLNSDHSQRMSLRTLTPR